MLRTFMCMCMFTAHFSSRLSKVRVFWTRVCGVWGAMSEKFDLKSVDNNTEGPNVEILVQIGIRVRKE